MLLTASQICIGCPESILASWYFMNKHIYTVTPVQVGGGFFGFFCWRPEPVWCCNVMVENWTPHGEHSAPIWYVYKLFWHLDMAEDWHIMVPPYIFRSVKVGGGFSGYWGGPEPVWCNDVMVKIKSPVECIPHPYYMYTKCFSILMCWGFACGSTPTTVFGLCRSGVDFWDLG